MPAINLDAAKTAIKTAQAHAHKADMRSSADLNIRRALKALAHGDGDTAWYHAARSLQYSVGVLHPAYRETVALLQASAAA